MSLYHSDSKNANQVVNYEVTIGGTKIKSSKLGENRIYAFSVKRAINKIPFAKISILDSANQNEIRAFKALDKTTFDPGETVSIKIGYDRGDEVELFNGVIVKCSIKMRRTGNSMFILECKDNAVKMTSGRKSRRFEEKTDKEVLGAVISENGLSAEVQELDEQHYEIVQHRSSDWDFVLSRADVNARFVVVRDGKVKVVKPELSKSLDISFQKELVAIDAEIDAQKQFKKSTSYSWCYKKQEVINKKGSEQTGGYDPGRLTAGKLAGVLGKEAELKHTGQVKKGELQPWADSRLTKSRLAKIRGTIKFKGQGDYKLNTTVGLKDVGSLFEGEFYIGGIYHEVVEGMWFTTIQMGIDPEWYTKRTNDLVENPASGLLPGVHGLQIGKVVKLEEDPDKEDRIKIKLPIIDGEDGLWTRISATDAGNKRGTVFRPEIGDEVVVGFLNGDPRDPIMLGQLHSSKSPAPIKPEDKNHDKGYHTRSDMKMLFNDEHKIMTFETPAGNTMILDEKDKSITIEDENKNKMYMSPTGIKIESPKDITIEAQGNIKIEAKMNFNTKSGMNTKQEAEINYDIKSGVSATMKSLNVELKGDIGVKVAGTATAELSATGMVTVRGMPVKIN